MRVVLIFPSAAERTALAALLQEDGHEVIETASREEGIRVAIATHPDAIVADVKVPELDGLSLLGQLGPTAKTRVILLCPRSDRRINRVGLHCLTKPIDLRELQDRLDRDDPPNVRCC